MGGAEKFHINYAPRRQELEVLIHVTFPDLAEKNVYLIECRDLRDPPRDGTDARCRTSRRHVGTHPDLAELIVSSERFEPTIAQAAE